MSRNSMRPSRANPSWLLPLTAKLGTSTQPALRIAHVVDAMTKKTKHGVKKTGSAKKKVPASQRATTRAALAKTPEKKRGKITSKDETILVKTPKTPKAKTPSSGVKKPKGSWTKKVVSSEKRRPTPKKPANTTTYIMNQRKYGPQPKTPRPLSSMKSPRLETLATATTKPPESGLDMFGSMIGELSPRMHVSETADAERNAEVIKLCSIIAEQAKKIAHLETEVKNLRAQIQARAVAPVPTLRRVPSTTSGLASRLAGLFQREK